MKDKIIIVRDTFFGLHKNEKYDNISLENLDGIFDGFAQEIQCWGSHEYSELDLVNDLIKKVKHGGKISFIGEEFYEVVRDSNKRVLSLENAQIKFYGNDGEKKRLYSLDDLVNRLLGAGFNISKKRLKNYKYFVEAIRP